MMPMRNSFRGVLWGHQPIVLNPAFESYVYDDLLIWFLIGLAEFDIIEYALY